MWSILEPREWPFQMDCIGFSHSTCFAFFSPLDLISTSRIWNPRKHFRLIRTVQWVRHLQAITAFHRLKNLPKWRHCQFNLEEVLQWPLPWNQGRFFTIQCKFLGLSKWRHLSRIVALYMESKQVAYETTSSFSKINLSCLASSDLLCNVQHTHSTRDLPTSNLTILAN